MVLYIVQDISFGLFPGGGREKGGHLPELNLELSIVASTPNRVVQIDWTLALYYRPRTGMIYGHSPGPAYLGFFNPTTYGRLMSDATKLELIYQSDATKHELIYQSDATKVLLALEVSLGVAYSKKLEWLPEEFFNPQREPRECGLNSDEPAYICDPNRILGENIHNINWHLKDAVYNSTRCPCSNYYCEFDGRKDKGYHIGVALVRKMKLQANADGSSNSPKDQAQLFAYRLENSKWKMGNCEEDIIIFYSQEDSVLAIYGGSTANVKLTPYYQNLLRYKVDSRLKEGRIVDALNNLIYDLKKVLNCDSSFGNHCELHDYQAVSSGPALGVFNVMIALSLILTVFIMFP
ncbi:hypothetical protein Btru_001024 [Bulinus truncatus]|nr:hypothetical protein Btru_001024 [Bulinus truncatus]